MPLQQLYLGLLLENWCLTVGKISDFHREDSKSDVCWVQQQTMFQEELDGTLPPIVGVMFEINNIEIKAPPLKSWAIKELKFARLFNLIRHLQTLDEFVEGVRIKFLFPEFVYRHYFCCKLQETCARSNMKFPRADQLVQSMSPATLACDPSAE